MVLLDFLFVGHWRGFTGVFAIASGSGVGSMHFEGGKVARLRSVGNWSYWSGYCWRLVYQAFEEFEMGLLAFEFDAFLRGLAITGHRNAQKNGTATEMFDAEVR